MIQDGAVRREKLVMEIADSLPGAERFTAFGAARAGILEAVAELGRVHPEIDQEAQVYFGMSGWNRREGLH